MRSLWEELYQRLERGIRTLQANKHFKDIRKRRDGIGRFSDPAALLDYLHDRDQDPEEKNTIYVELLREARTRGRTARLAADLVWLGLWSGLDCAFCRCKPFFEGALDDLAVSFSERIEHLIQHADLDRINIVAAALVMNTERQVKYLNLAEARYMRLFSRFEQDQELPAEDNGPDNNHSTLGLPPTDSFEEEKEHLRAWLGKIVGDDADLVIGVLDGHTQGEMGKRLGLSPPAARKRYRRALKRIAREIERVSNKRCPILNGPTALDK
jgi:hypothetical protein